MALTGPIRIAVDIGGTFTDLHVLEEASGIARAFKVPTTPEDPAIGLVDGITGAASAFGFDVGQVKAVLHGTTIATNAVLERKLPVGGLITTAGFEDVLEIGRHVRQQVYAAKAEPRTLLIPRRRRVGVIERVRADGTVEIPLDDESIAAAAKRLLEHKCETVAVSLLHAYANPDHERAVADRLAALMPGVPVSTSHSVSPEIREFERTSTTVLNALLMPVVGGYLERLKARLSDLGLTCPVFLVQSNGGVTTPETAAEQPARLLLSGPSGGALAAETIADELGSPNLIAVDMGGTSYDVSIVSDGRTRQVTEGVVDGCPVRLPMIEIRTVGAGGGSIARVDETGRLRVGPESAGAMPGPVCYRRGGEKPTVTDANVVLGRIDPAFFLGGEMALDVDGAHDAIRAHVAEPLGLDVDTAADGVLRVAVVAMAAAIRLSLFEKGLDPKDFALISFGGAGGLHACDTAAEIGAERVVFPRDPGTLSAWGMLSSDIVHDLARSRLMAADATAVPELAEIVSALIADGNAMLARDGVVEEDRRFPLSLDLRYRGQAYEIRAPLTSADRMSDAIAAFHDLHMAQYAHAEPEAIPEIVTTRLAATGVSTRPKPRPFDGSKTAKPKGERSVFADGQRLAAAVYDREMIGLEDSIAGPAILEEAHSTLFVPTGWTVAAAKTGDLIATRVSVEESTS